MATNRKLWSKNGQIYLGHQHQSTAYASGTWGFVTDVVDLPQGFVQPTDPRSFVDAVARDYNRSDGVPNAIVMHALTWHFLSISGDVDVDVPNMLLLGTRVITTWDMPEWDYQFSYPAKHTSPVKINYGDIGELRRRAFGDTKSNSIKARSRR